MVVLSVAVCSWAIIGNKSEVLFSSSIVTNRKRRRPVFLTNDVTSIISTSIGYYHLQF
jgi:hypothetical protein